MFRTGIFMSVAATLLLSVSAVDAQQLSGNVIIDVCNEDPNGGNCLGFIVGTIDGMRWAADVAAMRSGATEAQAMRNLAETLLGACTPPTSTGGQLSAVALKYMQNHPENWHEPAVVLIHRALMEAFPCR